MSGEDDLLERATRALRELPPPSDRELAAGKGALLWAHRTQKHKRGRTMRWLLPLAAVLAAGSALAHTTGQLERMVDSVASVFTPAERKPAATKERAPRRKQEPARMASTPALPGTAPAPLPAPLPATPSPEPSPTVVARAPEPAARAPSPSKRPKAPAQVAPSTPSSVVEAASEYVREGAADEAAAAPAPAPSEDLARYREAHRAHFGARDFAAALRGWEQYLSEYPRGTFAVEARYNRAICLIRLTRKAEARAALLPFARGEVARGYRQLDAKKLLEALE